MTKSFYKIKHDFLFALDDNEVNIMALPSTKIKAFKLKLSAVLKAKNEMFLLKRIKTDFINIVIIDDLPKCINPSSERYKQFIIRCIYRKLTNNNFIVYM